MIHDKLELMLRSYEALRYGEIGKDPGYANQIVSLVPEIAELVLSLRAELDKMKEEARSLRLEIACVGRERDRINDIALAAKKDAERLDWLESTLKGEVWSKILFWGGGKNVGSIVNGCGDPVVLENGEIVGDTLRETIDAARDWSFSEGG